MGFNLSGIVINRNMADSMDELQEQLGLDIEYVQDITFQEASANYKDDGLCDIFFSEKGTVLFANPEISMDRVMVEGNTFSFIISEFAMAFNFVYFENGKHKRSFFQLNLEMQEEKGERLPCEENETDGSTMIWKQLEVVLGRSFWSIDFEEKAVRYKVK